jgi:hypothetical protein
LYGGWVVVARIRNVLQKYRVQRRIGKSIDGIRYTSSGGFDRDIVILVKVDTGVLHRCVLSVTEKFFFDTLVASADDMLSILPGTKTVHVTLTTSMMGFFSPLTPTTAGGREAAAAASPITIASPVATTGRGRRGMGASPIIPA